MTTAAVAAGHLSSSSIYPACFAPYLLSTACTDGRVHLWQCVPLEDENTGKMAYQWKEWKMMSTGQGASDIEVEGEGFWSLISQLFSISNLRNANIKLTPEYCIRGLPSLRSS